MTTKYIVVTPGTRDSIQIDNPFELLDFAQHEISRLTDKRLAWLIPELNNILASALHNEQPVALWNGNVIVAKTLPDLLRSIQETIVSTPPSTDTVQ